MEGYLTNLRVHPIGLSLGRSNKCRASEVHHHVSGGRHYQKKGLWKLMLEGPSVWNMSRREGNMEVLERC